ncbi:hypothetical protein P9302_16095 [Brevibacillus agri]|uniref:hypothetical protein n=1 Tax=Brevibacillus agri TaxID=51101 RepID=UPI002E1D115D|nr:hypothetical protein [Brevibacillus agri]
MGQSTFVLPRKIKMENAVEKTIREDLVPLDNGYTISVRRERISTCGRSIFREIDKEQVVIEILDKTGKVTKRLPIPAGKSEEIASIISG